MRLEFRIKHTNETEKRILSYDTAEYSFDMVPSVDNVLFTVSINYLNLTVDENNKVVQVWGYCPYASWQKGLYDAPESETGNLIVVAEVEPGFTYRANNNGDWPIYVNKNTGWICIGDPNTKMDAVEFINDCIAVVEDMSLVSLWLKPKALPEDI